MNQNRHPSKSNFSFVVFCSYTSLELRRRGVELPTDNNSFTDSGGSAKGWGHVPRATSVQNSSKNDGARRQLNRFYLSRLPQVSGPDGYIIILGNSLSLLIVIVKSQK